MAGVRLDEAQPVGLKPDPQELRNGGSPIGQAQPVGLKPDPQELRNGGSQPIA